MSQRARKPASQTLTLKDAFETEYARRELERRAAEEATRRQQVKDLADAEMLHTALVADPDFLEIHGLTADRRRYMVSLDHARFRITAYFEGGHAALTLSDKRTAPAAAAPRRQETAADMADALRLIALMLVDESRPMPKTEDR
jgi:hypothetical protein